MLPATTKRVQENTAEQINRMIWDQTLCNLQRIDPKDRNQIERRLRELDREWDIERTLEANASALCVFGTAMGIFSSRKWLLLPAVVGGFLFQHATQGWCPPLVILRRMGVRTQSEIELEREALLALRGDYQDLPRDGSGGGVEDLFKELSRRRNAGVTGL